MRVLVEVSQGIGNCVQGTPLCHALWLLGHDVDLFVHREGDGAAQVAEMLRDWPVLGSVLTSRRQLQPRRYDFAVSCYGKHLLRRLFPPGLCISVVRTATLYQSETEANMRVARWLGFEGDTPPSHVGRSQRQFNLGPRAVTVHAGCAHFAQEKRWPHWREICARVAAAGWRVVVVGTASDRSPENWEAAYECHFDLGLRDLNALLSESSVHLGNDSGVGHMAAAAGLPGLILYGPTSPVKNAPNCRAMRVMAAPRQGDEEHELTSRQPVPIGRLPLEVVWAEVEKLLAAPAKEPPRHLISRRQDTPETRAAALKAMPSIAEAPPADPAVHVGPATRNSLGQAYDDLEHAQCRATAEGVLLAANGAISRTEVLRRAGEYELRLAGAIDSVTPKARHKARFHAREAIRAGLWWRGAAAFLRA